ncbi:MAG: hypothetical protein WED11_05135 [Natronospirillum sp.]
MKNLLASSIALTTLTTMAQANVFLPNIGIDGWNTDGILAQGAALNQGYLTLAHDQNHFINPAYSLDLQDSAQANLGGSNSGGVWTEVFGQKMGLYLGRQNGDSALDNGGNLYALDTTGNGNLNNTSDVSQPDSLFDLYWANRMDAGDLGLRLNVRAHGESGEEEINDDDLEETSTTSFYQVFLSAGFISQNMPMEATAHLGLPFGGQTVKSVDDNAGTETIDEFSSDSGLRWGATAKYTLSETQTSRTLISGFVGGVAASYNQTTEDVVNDNQTFDSVYIQTHLALGVVGSYERMINNRTRLVTSAGLTRISRKIGRENQLEGFEQEDFVETAQYSLPIAVGIEFASSERTEWSASVSDYLFTRESTTTYDWNGTDEKVEETETEATNWGSPNPNVQIGVNRELVERLHGHFVLNTNLVGANFFPSIATQATLTYEF